MATSLRQYKKTPIDKRVESHPCYSPEAQHYFARVHLPVAPACNIQCNYCNRKFDCANESRPGVSSTLLSPEAGLKKVMAVAMRLPQLSVVGIAGPGDPLANPEKTFGTLRLIKEAIPMLKLCLSTNGLRLNEFLPEILELGIDHVTVTINALDPDIGKEIYAWAFHGHKRLTGKDAAAVLIENQLEGLRLLAKENVLVKVNTVVIPGVNDAHVPKLAKELKNLGAFLVNLMPVAISPGYGSAFSKMGVVSPSPQAIEALQSKIEANVNLMRHCRLCRADASGLLCKDTSQEKGTCLEEETIEQSFDVGVIERMHAHLEQRIETDRMKREQIIKSYEAYRVGKALSGTKIAVATKGMGLVNEHFGHAKEFLVYEVQEDGSLKLLGARKVELYCATGSDCQEEEGAQTKMSRTLKALEGVQALFVMAIGPAPEQALLEAGIEVVRQIGPIEEAFMAWAKEKISIPALEEQANRAVS